MATLGADGSGGTEKYFAKDFCKEFPGSILGTSVGFMSPDPNASQEPSYEEVCEGTTGFVEVLHMLFDSDKASFEEVCKYFFTFHDPTNNER